MYANCITVGGDVNFNLVQSRVDVMAFVLAESLDSMA